MQSQRDMNKCFWSEWWRLRDEWWQKHGRDVETDGEIHSRCGHHLTAGRIAQLDDVARGGRRDLTNLRQKPLRPRWPTLAHSLRLAG